LAAAWGVTLVWAERLARARYTRYLRFWSTSWAWAGIVILNPLVWPYWLLFCLPLFLAYVVEATRKPQRRVDVAFASVCLVFALANWTQNTSVVHRGASLVAVLVLLFDAQRRAHGRGLSQGGPARAEPLSFYVPERTS
jgi:hypothetical protein